MSALGHYLEAEGIPTVLISLVREHTEALAPPRALWVPFALGRPFGVPGDSAFQREVLLRALRLLERTDGPVLQDFAGDAPAIDPEEDLSGLACPVFFPAPDDAGSVTEQLVREVSQLSPWYHLARTHRGRTTLGVTGLSPEELAARIAAWSETGDIAGLRPDLGAADTVRLTSEELRAFYSEAKSLQPGPRSQADIQNWYWRQTAAGRAVRAIRDRVRTSDDTTLRALASSGLVPRAMDDDTGGVR